MSKLYVYVIRHILFQTMELAFHCIATLIMHFDDVSQMGYAPRKKSSNRQTNRFISLTSMEAKWNIMKSHLNMHFCHMLYLQKTMMKQLSWLSRTRCFFGNARNRCNKTSLFLCVLETLGRICRREKVIRYACSFCFMRKSKSNVVLKEFEYSRARF